VSIEQSALFTEPSQLNYQNKINHDQYLQKCMKFLEERTQEQKKKIIDELKISK
jgi:hypothetical protein